MENENEKIDSFAVDGLIARPSGGGGGGTKTTAWSIRGVLRPVHRRRLDVGGHRDAVARLRSGHVSPVTLGNNARKSMGRSIGHQVVFAPAADIGEEEGVRGQLDHCLIFMGILMELSGVGSLFWMA
ncbi:hypothetical protein GWI33_019000 [Rhynchophorus ferrugineus]|uniref:Uncharacterized protein n=1 Tax=Rhynchophorus ferrugineus TaxID=354439 RepID=A0A834I682_RHYFE|nr:hypothetical protein GWI33_019000 [Rhynchophorus ferrugineus]